MSDVCPTKRIQADNEQGFVIINEDDFDPEKGHELYEDEDTPPSSDEDTSDEPTSSRKSRNRRA